MHIAARDRGHEDQSESHYELFYASLFQPGRGFAFPCDATGNVKVHELTDRALDNYRYSVRAVGADLGQPRVKERPLAGS
jgi:hypothetical protein